MMRDKVRRTKAPREQPSHPETHALAEARARNRPVVRGNEEIVTKPSLQHTLAVASIR